MTKGKGLFLAMLTGLFGVVVLAASDGLAAQGAMALSSADCVKCHAGEPKQIESKGMAHKTEIECQSCHESHRPAVADNIPLCSSCHSGTAHYELPDCHSCHNPHMPLEVTLSGDLKAPCLTCHQTEGSDLAAHPSKHGAVACNFCHADRHGVIPQCMECHESHAETMTQADCASCHQAHQPLTLSYGSETPSILCASCHDDAYRQLGASPAKHQSLACVACHQEQHKMVPRCSDCHGTPHAEGMHKKFPRCGDCHGTAHDLNNWSGKQGA